MSIVNLLSKIFLTILTIALFFFLALSVYFAKKNLFTGAEKDELPVYTKVEPLNYESIGNYPQLEESSNLLVEDKKFTLEFGTCNDKICIEKTLENLYNSGITAFYTPSEGEGKTFYSIRRGIFNSRQLAEKAQSTLTSEKKISSKVIEL